MQPLMPASPILWSSHALLCTLLRAANLLKCQFKYLSATVFKKIYDKHNWVILLFIVQKMNQFSS